MAGLNTVLVGAQWGDEGKGKIIDVLTDRADWVVRYQGGNNAGHTVVIGGRRHVLHLVPSGIFRENRRCVIGNGLVIDAEGLLAELKEVRDAGLSVAGRLFISDRAHLVLPYHRSMDSGRESRLGLGERIGTTQRGIGPAYADKAMRTGLRMGVLLDPDLPAILRKRVADANRELSLHGLPPVDPVAVTARCLDAAAVLAPFVCDTVTLLNEAIGRGESVLCEGAHGTMLDIDFGTYPFVTSSNCTAGGACTGTGIPPHRIDRVIGVLKAYTTRVGEGPFPTELLDATGEHLRDVGREYGATTGRPRRCGWFDAVIARHAATINGIDAWAMTKLDVLGQTDPIRVCTAYRCDGQSRTTVPADLRCFAKCEPVYEELPGWNASIGTARRIEDLPPKARAYIRRIEELTGVPVKILSVGPGREHTIEVEGGLRPS